MAENPTHPKPHMSMAWRLSGAPPLKRSFNTMPHAADRKAGYKKAFTI